MRWHQLTVVDRIRPSKRLCVQHRESSSKWLKSKMVLRSALDYGVSNGLSASSSGMLLSLKRRIFSALSSTTTMPPVLAS